jgi:hypothetical protein
LAEGDAKSPEGLPASDRQRLLDRLVVSYLERLKLLDELDNLRKEQPENRHEQTLLEGFSGPPPYSVLRVDALRDEQDALRERLQSLASTERALETLKLGRIDAQRQRSASPG